MEWAPAIRPTHAEIDLDSVVANARLVASWAHSPILAVVKADAYGHGATQVALALEHSQAIAGFAVSLVEEGIELRAGGIELPILIMGPSLVDAYDAVVKHKLTPFISDVRHLQPLALAAQSQSTRLGIHLKVDTGMGRLGISPGDVGSVLDKVDSMSDLKVLGVGSHLACADFDDPEDYDSMTHRQLKVFSDVVSLCSERDMKFHVANSDGITRFKESRYDLARPGIALYGNGGRASDLLPVMSLVSQITQLRDVLAGTTVSYGARWTATRASTLAIVPVGYADGLPRNLSGKGNVLIAGKRCEIVGTISMDMIVVDVTEISHPNSNTVLAIGDEVILWGRQGNAEIRVAEIAQACGISEYEVTCGISKRVPRVFSGMRVAGEPRVVAEPRVAAGEPRVIAGEPRVVAEPRGENV